MKEFKFKIVSISTGKTRYGKIKARTKKDAHTQVEYNTQSNPRAIDTYQRRFIISIRGSDGVYKEMWWQCYNADLLKKLVRDGLFFQ